MKYVTETKHVPLGFGEIAGGALDGQAVTLKGAVHSLRAMGGITFLALRVRDGAVQCVCRPEELPEGLCEECAAVVTGTVRREERAPGGRELAAEEVPEAAQAAGLSAEQVQLITEENGAYKLKFKAVELWERLGSLWDKEKS